MNNKINKNSVPEGFTVKLALVDFLPVLFFLLTSIVLGISFKSITFIVGASLTFIAGLLKVIWKIIVAIKNKNIWCLFVQMRIVMPIGFLIMIIGFIIYAINHDSSVFFSLLLNPFTIIFLALGVIGMILMIVFAIKLDSTNVKSNWIEQLVNGISQMCFFIAFLIALLI